MGPLPLRTVLVISVLSVQACLFGGTTSVRSYGPVHDTLGDEVNREGVRYYVARDVFAFEGKVIKSSSRKWAINPDVTYVDKQSRDNVDKQSGDMLVSDDSLAKYPLCVVLEEAARWDSTIYTLAALPLPDFEHGAKGLACVSTLVLARTLTST